MLLQCRLGLGRNLAGPVRLGASWFTSQQVFRLFLPVLGIFLRLVGVAHHVRRLGQIGNTGFGNAGKRAVAKLRQLFAKHRPNAIDQSDIVRFSGLTSL